MTKTPRTGCRFAAASLGAFMLLAGGAAADQVFTDDVIVDGSLCVGVDCVNGENFGFDTIRMKENNLRLSFVDTSTSGAFPTRDWRIVANDSANGGANYLAFEDTDASRRPFQVDAGARADALRVSSAGRVGFGTAAPLVTLHAVEGNTPTLRLEQNGSSGFTAQTWDIAGNETNFFIRDATNSSTLPFRLFPGAPSDALVIEADGDVVIGRQSAPTNAIGDLVVAGSGVKLVDIVSTNNQPTQYRMITDSGNRRFVALNAAGTVESQVIFGNTNIKLAGVNDSAELWATIDTNGINLPAGAAFSVNGTGLNVPDYVFGADYDLMPLTDLAAFIDANSHLPGVPSAAEVRANGLDLTAMQLTLLEKVEELTLYTLHQERELAKLRQQLDTMKN